MYKLQKNSRFGILQRLHNSDDDGGQATSKTTLLQLVQRVDGDVEDGEEEDEDVQLVQRVDGDERHLPVGAFRRHVGL